MCTDIPPNRVGTERVGEGIKDGRPHAEVAEPAKLFCMKLFNKKF